MKNVALIALLATVSASAQQVEFSTDPAHLIQGRDVLVRFTVRDQASGTPLEGRYPSAWVDRRDQPMPCKERVKKLLTGDVFSRPEIDFNTYYALVMNSDATITVVDPQFGYGGTKLLATIPLRSPGEDWALSEDQVRLFVSMPQAGQVAIIDTASWRVLQTIHIGPGAGRMGRQPDGHSIWATYDSGVVAIDADTGHIARRLPLDAGPHEVAFSTDSRWAFLTNRSSGNVTVIDARTLTKVRDLPTGHAPASVAVSAKSQSAYITDAEDGTVTVLDGVTGTAVSAIPVDRGLGAIRFTQDGRFGLILNPARKQVHVLDASTNRIVQTAATEHEPDQVTFSAKLAYIRQRDSETVLMIPLDALGRAGTPIPVADFPAGQHSLGKVSLPSPADSMIRAPGDDAVLVANPADRAIYYYKEGMAAPMGFFSNYSREPRAVLVLDRSLRPRSPGVYQTGAHLEHAGLYTVAFVLDSPQIVRCWDVAVDADPNLPQTSRSQVEVESLLESETVRAGVPITVRFRARDVAAGTAKSSARDVRVLAFLAPGVWQQRKPAQSLANGIYEVTFVLPRPGLYYLNVESVSLGLTMNAKPMVLRAVPPTDVTQQ